MKFFLLLLFLSFLAFHSLIAFAEYNSFGVRDPMIKTIRQEKEEKTDEKTVKKKEAVVRQREIYNIIKKCKIEGIVISKNKRLVLINDRLLAEGDKILPDCDVYIYRINYKLIEFSLDGQIATYSLSIPK